MAASYANQEIKFCPYCGKKLDTGARFCKEFGQAVSAVNSTSAQPDDSKQSQSGTPTERKTVYEGYIHKCPNCGEILKAFVTHCPSCGYEIRDTRSANSVKEFAEKLERIEARQMPAFEEKRSVMKMVFGKDFKNKDEAEEAKNDFEEQKEQEKATLIINYSVPNTKEDILEFMILAASNINVKKSTDDEVTKAWIAKLEQVYQRAEISMGNSPDFLQIKNIYDSKKKELKRHNRNTAIAIIAPFTGSLFLLGLLWNPVATIGIAVGVIVLIIIGVILFKRK